MSDPTPYPEPRALTHRKRVVAREVTEVEAANRDSAGLVPDVISPGDAAPGAAAPRPPADPVVVVDPTTLGRRHRRSSHERVYRWTQALTATGGLASVVGLVCAIADDVEIARGVAIAGIVLGCAATYMSGRNSLAGRLRGWAIASAVFSTVILLMTWVQPALFGEDRVDVRQRLPAKTSNAPPPDARQP
jgi:hypothetical protein